MRALSAPQRAFFKSQHASPPFFARIFQPTPFSFATLPTPSFSCTRLSEHFPARRPRIHCNRRHNAHDSNLFGAQKKPRVHRPQLFNFSVFRDRRFPLFASSGRLPAFCFPLQAFCFPLQAFSFSHPATSFQHSAFRPQRQASCVRLPASSIQLSAVHLQAFSDLPY